MFFFRRFRPQAAVQCCFHLCKKGSFRTDCISCGHFCTRN